MLYGMLKFDLNEIPYKIRFDLIYNSCLPCLLFPLFCVTIWGILPWKIRWRSDSMWKEVVWGVPYFLDVELKGKRWQCMEESKHCWTLHPTLLHIEINRDLFCFCVCKREEKDLFTLKGWGMGCWREKKRRILSLGVCAKPSLLGFLPQGLGREKNKRENSFFSFLLSHPHLL